MTAKYPRVFIRDNNDNIVGVLDTEDYFNFKITRTLSGAGTIVTISIYKTPELYSLINTTANISFLYKGITYWLNCVIVEQEAKYLTITAWSLGMEYNNETVNNFKSPTAWTIAEYITKYLDFEKILTIGINELPTKKLTLEWTGEQTTLARFFSVATNFEAELEFVSNLNIDGSLKNITLNIYQKQDDTHNGLGIDRRDNVVYTGGELKTIKRTESKIDLYTAVRAVGKDGINISAIDRVVNDSKGNVLYYTPKNNGAIYAPQSRDLYPSNVFNKIDRWIMLDLGETQYESAEALYGYMLSELKKRSLPEVEWEILGYVEGGIGDRIRIVDEAYNPTMFLDVRIIGQEIDVLDPRESVTTFSNVKELKSQLDPLLLNTINYLINAAKPYTIQMNLTGSGLIFKNGVGITTLKPEIYRGLTFIPDRAIEWFKDDILVSTETDLVVSANDVTNTSIYRLVVTINGEEVARQDVTFTHVRDGAPGKAGETTFTWYVYAKDRNGTGITLNPTNMNFMGVLANQKTEIPSLDPALYKDTWIELVGNIIIGARNYQQGSSEEFKLATFTGWNFYPYFDQPIKNIQKGTPIIVSAYLKPDKLETGIKIIFWDRDNKVTESAELLTTYIQPGSQGYTTITTTVPIDAVSTRIAIRHSSNTVVIDTCQYKEVQLEFGTKQSSWTPAIEDVQNQITTIGDIAMTIPRITLSLTAPTVPKPNEGDQWWVGTGNNVTQMKTFKGGIWVPQGIDQSVLNIKELNAVTINSPNINGGKVSGSEFIAPFDKPVPRSNLLRVKGEASMKDGDLVTQSNFYLISSGVTQYSTVDTITSGALKGTYSASTASRSYELSSSGLTLTDVGKGMTSFIGPDSIYDTGWVQLKGATLQARRLFGVVYVWFNWFGLNGTGLIGTLPANMNPGRQFMLHIEAWTTSTNPDVFQTAINGTITKITNNNAATQYSSIVCLGPIL